jgi:hypothetical protein
MPVFLVRTIDKHDLVGIYAAPNVMDLAFLIDEAGDPNLCEYQRLGPGGVMWENPAARIPIEPDADDEEKEKDSIPWARARFTEAWDMSVYGVGKCTRWTTSDAQEARIARFSDTVSEGWATTSRG